MENQSPDTNAIYPAFLKAQIAMGSAVKDSVNPHFRSKYANLPSVVDAVKGALNSNGIVYRWISHYIEDSTFMECRLVHAESGQWISYTYKCAYKDNGNEQARGSSTTYAKRYSLVAVCGIPEDIEDDDANIATTNRIQKLQKPQEEKPSMPPEAVDFINQAARKGSKQLDHALSTMPKEIRMLISQEALKRLKERALAADSEEVSV